MTGPMNKTTEFPSFDVLFPGLNGFIQDLVEEYQAGSIRSWNDLAERVQPFFTSERMDQIEALVPGWRKMASYIDGYTLLHVMCAFMGLFMLPEFLALSARGQQIMKWIILFHDVEKKPQHGKRDHPHAFRSAAGAAQALPKLGFPTTSAYDQVIDEWSELTCTAVTARENPSDFVQDNRKLPQILEGIQRMFGQDSPAALILKTILFHMAIDMDFWPPPAPLREDEMERYFDLDLLPLLRVMHLADGEGWLMFDPEKRQRGRTSTLAVFDRVERMVSLRRPANPSGWAGLR